MRIRRTVFDPVRLYRFSRRDFPIFATCVVISVFLFGCGENQPPDAHHTQSASPAFSLLKPGDTAPEFEGYGLDGEPIEIGPGQPLTFVNLWATWCATCIEEFPDIEDLHQKLNSDTFRIVAVNVDELDSEAIDAFVTELGVTFPVALDPAGDYQDRMKSVAMPSSFLIDQDGVLIKSWTGRLTEEQLLELESLINDRRS